LGIRPNDQDQSPQCLDSCCGVLLSLGAMPGGSSGLLVIGMTVAVIEEGANLLGSFLVLPKCPLTRGPSSRTGVRILVAGKDLNPPVLGWQMSLSSQSPVGVAAFQGVLQFLVRHRRSIRYNSDLRVYLVQGMALRTDFKRIHSRTSELSCSRSRLNRAEHASYFRAGS